MSIPSHHLQWEMRIFYDTELLRALFVISYHFCNSTIKLFLFLFLFLLFSLKTVLTIIQTSCLSYSIFTKQFSVTLGISSASVVLWRSVLLIHLTWNPNLSLAVSTHHHQLEPLFWGGSSYQNRDAEDHKK